MQWAKSSWIHIEGADLVDTLWISFWFNQYPIYPIYLIGLWINL